MSAGFVRAQPILVAQRTPIFFELCQADWILEFGGCVNCKHPVDQSEYRMAAGFAVEHVIPDNEMNESIKAYNVSGRG